MSVIRSWLRRYAAPGLETQTMLETKDGSHTLVLSVSIEIIEGTVNVSERVPHMTESSCNPASDPKGRGPEPEDP